jgi:hypothetical protein
VAHRTENTTVHNLTVDRLHTYYVQTADGTSALDHNTRCGEQKDYGETDLSRKAAAYRLDPANRVTGKQNIVILEYKKGRKTLTEPFPNDPGGLHSEEKMFAWMATKGIKPEHVTRIYSEREICGTKCTPLLRNTGLDTKVTWTFKSGTHISKDMARRALGLL